MTKETGNHQFVYAMYRIRERAESKLENMFASGEVCESENPQIKFQDWHWCILIDDGITEAGRAELSRLSTEDKEAMVVELADKFARRLNRN